jgi:3-hydroxyisobutyrate dehydrogenase-like beta-hydroxyacid dehydrogenase
VNVRIGWIGLGMIGTQMARRLLAAGHSLSVYPRGSGLSEIVEAGAGQCPAYATLAANSEVLILCLFNDAQVRAVLLDGGALAALQPGSILAIHTTGSPALAREIAALAPAGVDILDATFSGGPGEAAAGTLTMMVGGEAAAVARAEPVFAAYASNIHAVGEVGNAQVLKLLNNLLFATNLMNAAQTLILAEHQGFDASTFARIGQTSSGASFALARFTDGSSVEQMLERVRPYLEKDVATAIEAADDLGLDMTAFERTAAFFGPR